MKAFLILENGCVFEGRSFGAVKETVCEIVFNTSMVGYLEMLTDPSYAGEGLVLTYPLIGNCGVNREDWESQRLWPEALIVKELSRCPSNFRSQGDLDSLLKEQGIPGIEGIDVRKLTRMLREHGVMNGVITCREDFDLDETVCRAKEYKVGAVVEKVSCQEQWCLPGEGPHVAVLDLGLKKNMLNCLQKRGCQLTVYPYDTMADVILASKPDGIFLSNGPGDPKECGALLQTVSTLAESGVPLFAICLGHQLLALASGADTKKMKYGHHGSNHPVKDLAADRVYITAQNHGYEVIGDSFPEGTAQVTHQNVNDGSCEGVSYPGKPVFSVQFHPEASGGPLDTDFIFDQFIGLMQKGDKNA